MVRGFRGVITFNGFGTDPFRRDELHGRGEEIRKESPLFGIEGALKILIEQGLTIFLVSQEIERSLELSQRAYVLENSQITLEGKSDEMLNNDKVRESYLGM